MRARQRPYELSGGLRQRALIASAIALDPRLIIADEPTTALDVTVQAQVLELLQQAKERGKALILISHDLAVVSQLADTVAVMRHGDIVEYGPAAQLFSRPEHAYTRALIEAIPQRRLARRAALAGRRGAGTRSASARAVRGERRAGAGGGAPGQVVPRPRRGRAHRRRRRLLRAAAGGDPGDRRRVGLRQDDHGAPRARPARGRRRRRHAGRRGVVGPARARAAQAPRRHLGHLPGPAQLLRPALDGRAGSCSTRSARATDDAQGAQARGSPSCWRGRAGGRAPRPPPAAALRRPAPARRDRPGARRRSRG